MEAPVNEPMSSGGKHNHRERHIHSKKIKNTHHSEIIIKGEVTPQGVGIHHNCYEPNCCKLPACLQQPAH